ncbi:transporter substrate-binding domain-containing protein [Nitratireductor sp. PBL-C9]|uniref:transporter substrate-binding domain-containing protein n=1 Tax=Nitratireductor sp. PBL-C9 TaxID=3435013 RepID=UPI003D7EF2A9
MRKMLHRNKAILAIILTLASIPAAAEEATPPAFTDPKQQLSKPDISSLSRLRFLTTVDFYPFNYLDEENRISGVHIDLVRQICGVLGISERCQIQALPWNEIGPAIENSRAEAVIAGLAITEENRERYLFSRPYLRFPARLVTLRSAPLAEPLHEALKGKRIGVMDETAHELMLRDLFTDVQRVVYTRNDWLHEDLKSEKIDGIFGDGVKLGYWLASRDAQDCCVFSGGAYFAPEYLGQGLAVAVPKDMPQLVEAIDFALQSMNATGGFTHTYLRYFPVDFY